eukprot:2007-Heterococcus_DN1.PRE.1
MTITARAHADRAQRQVRKTVLNVSFFKAMCIAIEYASARYLACVRGLNMYISSYAVYTVSRVHLRCENTYANTSRLDR